MLLVNAQLYRLLPCLQDPSYTNELHPALHRDYSTCRGYHPEKKYRVSYKTILLEMPQKCNNHCHKAVALSFQVHLAPIPSLDYNDWWIDEYGEVSHFHFRTTSKRDWICSSVCLRSLTLPFFLSGQQMKEYAARQTIVQASWCKASASIHALSLYTWKISAL